MNHAHHFLIESPEKCKAFLAGVCRYCPAKKLFRNEAIDTSFVGQREGTARHAWHNQSDRHFDDYSGKWAS